MCDEAVRGETTLAEYLAYVQRFSTPAEVPVFSPHDPDVDAYARIIGLDGASPDFRQHLASEIDLCLLVNGFDRKRPSEVKRVLLRVSKAAARVSHEQRELVEALTALGHARLLSLVELHQEVTGNVRPPMTVMMDRIVAEADWLDRLSEIALKHALRLRGSSGPRGYFAFGTLVRRLAAVYKRATGRDAKVTRKPDGSIGGAFPAFVEVLLTKVLELSRASGRPFEHPNTLGARGAYIYEITRAGASKGQQASEPRRR